MSFGALTIAFLASTSSVGEAPLTNTPTIAATTTSSTGPDTEWLVLPIFQFNDDAGLIYGLHFPIVRRDQGPGPYAWYFEIKLRHSTKNRHEHFLLFDTHRFFGLRLTIRADVLHIDTANYFGAANYAQISDPEDPRYRYRLTEPRVQTWLTQKFAGDFLWGAGLTVNLTRTRYEPGSVLDQTRPLGTDGGHGLIGLFTLAYDSRDNELVPREGWFIEAYAKAATRPLGSSTSFQGVGLSAQTYLAVFPWLVLAQRLAIEDLGGQVPFYEQNRIGGRTNVFGLGGVYTQRGFLEARFTGRSKALSNSELRLYFPKLFDLIAFGLGAFVDVSAVLDDARFTELPDRMAPSFGGEINVKWLELILFRIDVGVSREGVLTYIEGRHLF